MLRIGDTIFSFDILEKKFRCDLPKCLGNCCRYGDSGAPLSLEETVILDEIWDDVKPYLRPEGSASVLEQGKYTRDFENDWVTPLVDGEECAYSTIRGNVLLCGIEQAWADGKIGFRKPLSCHLFPIRIKQYSEFRAVNYQEIAICKPGRDSGKESGVYVYEFLKEPLERCLGEELYAELCIAADELRKNGTLTPKPPKGGF
jgi:hypothetical protein